MSELQAIGDSMIRRFTYYVNNNPSCPLKITHSVGLSGATILELKDYLKDCPMVLDSSTPLLLFIGTNNIFKNTPFSVMQKQFKSLLRFIRRTHPHINNIILTQLPLFPRAKNNLSQIWTIHKFNKFLHSLTNQNTQFFQTQNFLDPLSDFQPKYSKNGGVDKIHFNNIGHSKFAIHLSQYFIN